MERNEACDPLFEPVLMRTSTSRAAFRRSDSWNSADSFDNDCNGLNHRRLSPLRAPGKVRLAHAAAETA